MQIVSLTMYVEVFQFVKFVSKTNIFAKIQFFYKKPNFLHNFFIFAPQHFRAG